MKKIAAAAAIICSVSSAALAADGAFPAYLALKAGASFQGMDGIKNTSNGTNLASVASDSQSDSTAVLGVAAGLNFKTWGAPIRAEVEYAYRTDFTYNPNPNFNNAAIPTRSDNTVNSHTVLFNGYFDINTNTRFTPYVGGGIGFAVNEADTTGTVIATGTTANYSQTRTEFAWTVGAGVAYAIDQNWHADLGYRYLDLGKVSMGDRNAAEMTGDLTSHEVLVALRYQF